MARALHVPRGFIARELLHESASASVFEITRGGEVFVCKRLLPRMVREPLARKAIQREAHALQALAGRAAPHWVADGDDEHGDYLVMERVGLASLAARMNRASPESAFAGEAFLARATRSAFSTLALMHEARDARGALAMVHADLSPGNLLVSEDGDETRLIDFGLASWRDAPREAGGAFRGTLLYAAPEVARGEPFDTRADYFALAASLAHAALGAPLRKRSGAALLAEAAETPIDTRPLEARVSSSIFRFLRGCLAFDPKDRSRGVLPPEVEDGNEDDG